jgi:hypothetical protein
VRNNGIPLILGALVESSQNHSSKRHGILIIQIVGEVTMQTTKQTQRLDEYD